MKNHHLSLIGAIFFFVGIILQIISWHYSYPIHIPELSGTTFTQFHPTTWLGLTFSFVGLFIAGFYTTKNSVKVFCASLFPVLFYSYALYFSYISSSDSGNVKGMFEVFHQTGIQPEVVSYFQYPTYFTLNEMTHSIIQVDVNGIAAIFFIVYGVLIGLFLFLFLSKITQDKYRTIAFIAIPLYFSGLFGFLNYQWVPQTIALVFFFMLLLVFDEQAFQYKIISIALFTMLVFSHAIIPAVFLIFYALNVVKNKALRNNFLIMFSIFFAILIYYTTFQFPLIVEAFTESIYGFGGEYTATVTGSFREPVSPTLQFISNINRIRMPFIWIAVSLGAILLFFKKKIPNVAFFLGVTGVFYLGLGMFYSVLGLRALQFFLVPLLLGVGYFLEKWKKLAVIIVITIMILSIFGPMSASYDQTQFQVKEEEYTCKFLVGALADNTTNKIGVGQVNWGYFMSLYKFTKGEIPIAIRAGKPEFYSIFNRTMEPNEFVIYNTNLGKEIIERGISRQEVIKISEGVYINNKIYQSGSTSILTG